MPSVTLSDEEWQRVWNILINAPVPWVLSNPLLLQISKQLGAQAVPASYQYEAREAAGNSGARPPAPASAGQSPAPSNRAAE
jgi:hypothetical protein